jgi:purine-cytosine permease-like protein
VYPHPLGSLVALGPGDGANHEAKGTEEQSMPIWAWILIIIVIVFLLGGFGYRRRR